MCWEHPERDVSQSGPVRIQNPQISQMEGKSTVSLCQKSIYEGQCRTFERCEGEDRIEDLFRW